RRRGALDHSHILCNATSPDTTGWPRVELKLNSLDEEEAAELVRLVRGIKKTITCMFPKAMKSTRSFGFEMLPPSVSFFLSPPDSTQCLGDAKRLTTQGGPVSTQRVSDAL